jgi:hypothetical protein
MKSACANCPWRTANHGKRTPWGFYKVANMKRLWNQIRGGGAPQSCHPTDPGHPDHVAAGAKPGATPQECAGSVVLVYREFEKLQACGGGTIDGDAVRRYLKEHRDGLTKNGIAYWLVSRYQFGGVPFVGGPKLPEVDMREEGIGRP